MTGAYPMTCEIAKYGVGREGVPSTHAIAKSMITKSLIRLRVRLRVWLFSAAGEVDGIALLLGYPT